jgi:hypothetical protein
MDNPTPEKTKQGWLEHLEAESWSAELIISGAAIYGSFQLPWLLNNLINFCLLNFSDDILDILYLVFTYLTFTITILMVNFVMHFVLRSLWVGLIGLTSVFPQGINEESDTFSKHYLQQLKADYGDLRGYNAKIDRTCSIIFAFSFSAAMIFLSIAIVVVAIATIAYLLHQLIPGINIHVAFFSLLGLVLVPSFLNGLLNNKKLREKPWVQKIHYPLFRRVGNVMFHIFQEPINRINNTFLTNFKKTQYTLRFLAYLALVLPVFMVVFIQSNALFATQNFYFKFDSREDRFYAQHYADELKEGQLILSPMIPSAQIFGSGLNLFLPLPTREEVKLHQKFGKYHDDPKLSEAENLLKSRAWFKEQAGKYFHIKVNGHVFDPALRSYNHPNAFEYGLLAFIPANLFQEGENLIQVQSEYRMDGKQRECFIPFWYSAK